MNWRINVVPFGKLGVTEKTKEALKKTLPKWEKFSCTWFPRELEETENALAITGLQPGTDYQLTMIDFDTPEPFEKEVSKDLLDSLEEMGFLVDAIIWTAHKGFHAYIPSDDKVLVGIDKCNMETHPDKVNPTGLPKVIRKTLKGIDIRGNGGIAFYPPTFFKGTPQPYQEIYQRPTKELMKTPEFLTKLRVLLPKFDNIYINVDSVESNEDIPMKSFKLASAYPFLNSAAKKITRSYSDMLEVFREDVWEVAIGVIKAAMKKSITLDEETDLTCLFPVLKVLLLQIGDERTIHAVGTNLARYYEEKFRNEEEDIKLVIGADLGMNFSMAGEKVRTIILRDLVERKISSIIANEDLKNSAKILLEQLKSDVHPVVDKIMKLTEKSEKIRAVILPAKVRSGYPPCINYLLEKNSRGINMTHLERLTLCSFLAKSGTDIEEIIKLFATQPDYKENYTRYQVTHISKAGLKPYNCDSLETEGVCKKLDPKFFHPICMDRRNPIKNPLSFYNKIALKTNPKTKKKSKKGLT